MRIRQWLLFGLAGLLFSCGADVQRKDPDNNPGATPPDPAGAGFQPGLQYDGSVAFERRVP